MSQYISSFLIEPVVRQARRFSRGSLGGSETEEHRDALATTALAAQEVQSHLAIETDTDGGDESHSLVTGCPEVVSPTPIDDPESGELHEWRGEQGIPVPPRLVEIESLESGSPARRHTLQAADDNPDNQLSGVASSLRSTTSSISNSARSIIDANMSPADGSGPAGQNVQVRRESLNSRLGEQSLPEDDGMSHMRKRIIAIQRTESSNEVKARLVHGVMTESHNSSQQNLHGPHIPRAYSPGSMQSSDRPFTPSSPKSMESLRQTVSPSTLSSSASDPANPFQISLEDLTPTYYVKPDPASKRGDNERRSSATEDEPKAFGCAHYKRNIKLQCSACNRWYTCRFCHDIVEDHMLNRRETKNMLCMLCGSAQPAGEECAKCSVRGAWYYCDVCKLWDDDPQKSIYHCNDCGICRIGQGLGKDFFHCKTCCVCMSISIRDTHRCIERSTDCDCPICGEYMFTSPQTVVFMRCGHSIHHRCYYEHMKSSYRCPICSRSIMNMEWQFSRLERAIEAQPMPPEFQDTKAWVYCNDCSAKTSVKYHWLGLKCAVCDSYNTAQLQILSGPSPSHSPTPLPSPPLPSRPSSRGRSRQAFTPLQTRTGTSAPPSAHPSVSSLVEFNPMTSNDNADSNQPQRSYTRSASALPAVSLTLSHSLSVSSIDTDAFMYSTSDEDEEDDVGFWGEGSPMIRRLGSPFQHVQGDGEMAVDDAEESESEDEGEGADGDGAMDIDEDEEEVDGMEIFGHR